MIKHVTSVSLPNDGGIDGIAIAVTAAQISALISEFLILYPLRGSIGTTLILIMGMDGA